MISWSKALERQSSFVLEVEENNFNIKLIDKRFQALIDQLSSKINF